MIRELKTYEVECDGCRETVMHVTPERIYDDLPAGFVGEWVDVSDPYGLKRSEFRIYCDICRNDNV